MPLRVPIILSLYCNRTNSHIQFSTIIRAGLASVPTSPRLQIDSSKGEIIRHGDSLPESPPAWPKLTKPVSQMESQHLRDFKESSQEALCAIKRHLEAQKLSNTVISNDQSLDIAISSSTIDGFEGVKGGDEDVDVPTDDCDDTEYTNRLQPILDFIQDRVNTLQDYATDSLQPIADFKSYWRYMFSNMYDELVRSGESNLLVTDPPIKTLVIELLDDAMEKRCPCCYDGGDDDIVIQSKTGITRGQLLRDVGQALYGVNERQEDGRGRKERLVVKAWDYMRCGEILVKPAGDADMRIWLYCQGGGRRYG